MNDLHPTSSAPVSIPFITRCLAGLAALLILLPAALGAQAGKVSPEAVELRNIGIAQLENERPEKAVETFERLIKLTPKDPLGYANLAIAHLRQQQTEPAQKRIGEALALDGERADLLRIRGDVLQWAGDQELALESYWEAIRQDPQDLESLYALYRQSTNINSDDARKAGAEAASKLSKLRPENVVVILAEGQRAIAAGERQAATASFLRLQELLWQARPVAAKALDQVLETLKSGEVAKARVPALRLENVLKITPMYRESLRELSTGIQGVPVERFLGEEPSSDFGAPKTVRFAGAKLADGAGSDVAVGDLNSDLRPDVVRLTSGSGASTVEIWLSAGDAPAAGEELFPARAQGETTRKTVQAPAGLERLLLADLDNDGHLDVLANGPKAFVYLRNGGDGTLTDATADKGLAGLSGIALEAVDYDIEGDLDLILAGGAKAPKVLRNSLEDALAQVGARVLPSVDASGVTSVVASDLDRDGDLDLLLGGSDGLILLDNLRQGRFEDISSEVGLGGNAVTAVATADLNNDGYPEILVADGSGISLRQRAAAKAGDRAAFGAPQRLGSGAGTGVGAGATEIQAADLDNDGRLDLLAVGGEGLAALRQDAQGGFSAVEISGAGAAGAAGVDVADLDGDGDLDLLTTGPEGLHQWTGAGAEGQLWLAVRLRGLDKGSSKNNVLGRGSVVEVRLGDAYQFREARGDVVHIGLGSRRSAYLMRVVWTNGVPQTRLAPRGNQLVVEEQLLKGSCPFLYAWDGERMAFVTDLLWGAPLGLPAAPGVWTPSDPRELVRVDGAQPIDGRYELRITEELWEAAFLDRVRLWVVDHPRDVEVASSLRMAAKQPNPHRVMASTELRPLAQALDGAGREVSQVVRYRDEIYADGYRPSPYQGVAAEPWSFVLDLGEAPAAPVRLHLDGWIFPADASLNLAVAQRSDLSWMPPRLEVEVDGRWQTLMETMGFPPGKTKTMVVDTPPLPEGAHRLRMVTTQWLSWDRIAWTTAAVDGVPVVQAQLEATRADFGFRGFSQLVRHAPNAPHSYDYHRVSTQAPWLPFPGHYTRFGDVLPLLEDADDLSVILAPGDEISLTFDASHLPAPRAGWQRTLFLESHGWDKDADRNTYRARSLEPLPFHGMEGYPGPDGTLGGAFPDTPEHREYLKRWLTREVKATEGV
ncbi:MAG: FG-GAP-like repeat-containing protein [Acidobacteriota bacterium]